MALPAFGASSGPGQPFAVRKPEIAGLALERLHHQLFFLVPHGLPDMVEMVKHLFLFDFEVLR